MTNTLNKKVICCRAFTN